MQPDSRRPAGALGGLPAWLRRAPLKAALVGLVTFLSTGAATWIAVRVEPHAAPLLVGLAAGLAAAGVVNHFLYQRPILRAAAACRTLQSGDLGSTVPAEGPEELCEMAHAVNDLAADAQEVLLLFAHLVRSARLSAEMMSEHLATTAGSGDGDEARRLAEILRDVDEMQATVRDFKYFRVAVEDGTIRDTGITTPQAATGYES